MGCSILHVTMLCHIIIYIYIYIYIYICLEPEGQRKYAGSRVPVCMLRTRASENPESNCFGEGPSSGK